MTTGRISLASVLLIIAACVGLRAQTLDPTIAPLEQTPKFDVFTVTLPSPVQNADPPNGTMYVEYYRPKREGKLPGVILLHHWGVVNPSAERKLAATLATRGIITAMLIMPYHLQRTPPRFKSGMAMLSPDVPRTVRSVEQTVAEVGVLAQWLKSQPEVDPQRIGLAGISLGAVIGALALGQVHEFQAAVLILGGADVADIIWDSPVTFKVRRELSKLGYTKSRLMEELAPIEPLNFLKPSDGRNVLMVNSMYDPMIRRYNALALWKALGKPEIVWIEAGHYVPEWGRPTVYRLTRDYFLYRFGELPQFSPPRRIRLRMVKLGLFFDRAPTVAVGGALELVKPAHTPLTLDLNVSTGGIGLGAGVNIGPHLTIGTQRKLVSPHHDVLPYALVHFTL
jgi:hypothetical protein